MSQLCPFCQNENLCGANSNKCWCMSEKVPRELIKLLPADSLHKECICKNCIILYKRNPEVFKAGLNGKAK